MKSFRCSIGIHKEYLEEGFPLGARNPLIVGVECDRCKRLRCVNAMHRIRMSNDLSKAFDEARVWLEKKTGQRVIGSFVHFR